MKRDIDSLKNPELSFDCIVIGGGIQGAGIAREASLQGFKTLLVDRGDFASGTSSRSTKLIHGGLRYLEQGRFKLVREALAERKLLLKIVPHLVRPLPFVFPSYKGDKRPLWQIRLGLSIYDWLATDGETARHQKLSKEEVLKSLPQLKDSGLEGGSLYWDAQMDDSRLCLEVLKSAHKLGCRVLNYVRATGFGKTEGKITSVQLKDLRSGETFEVQGKVVINAAGIRADEVRQLDELNTPKRLRWSKGIHLVTRRLLTAPDSGEPLAVVRPTKDGRVFFVLPWGKGATLIGTTDTEFTEKPSECYARKEDVEYLLREFRSLVPESPLKRNDVHITFSGLRSLINSSRQASSSLSREYEIEELPSGLLSVLGGKYTTFRSLAVKVAERIAKRLGTEPRYEDTHRFSLDGTSLEDEGIAKKHAEFEKRARTYGLTDEFQRHLWDTHGANGFEIFKLLDYDPTLKEGVIPGRFPMRAEVVYAIKDEMALTLTDFLRRRSQLFFLPQGGLDLLDGVAQVYQDYLHWSDEEIEKQKQDYRQEVERNIKALNAASFSKSL